jgi:type II secretory pathway component PulF
MELMQANIVPLIAISVVGIALCFVGALWMRKRKKDGFWIYTGGELLPVIGSFIVMGTAQFTGVVSVLLAVGIPVLFVILYANQRKHLTN